jgi:hypothetical protein
LATIPVVTAVYNYALKNKEFKLLFGMDANTYHKPESDQQSMVKFAQWYTSKNLNSCYGQTPNPANFTTFHARTHLQPQLNKAVRYSEKDVRGDRNLKDFILFLKKDFLVVSTIKDNTGDLKYVENMVFPTLTFPSDHGITSTVLKEIFIDYKTASDNDNENDDIKSYKQNYDRNKSENVEIDIKISETLNSTKNNDYPFSRTPSNHAPPPNNSSRNSTIHINRDNHYKNYNHTNHIINSTVIRRYDYVNVTSMKNSSVSSIYINNNTSKIRHYKF